MFLKDCEIQGAQQRISNEKLRLPSDLSAKVRWRGLRMFLKDCEIQGAQQRISNEKLRLPSDLSAKVRWRGLKCS